METAASTGAYQNYENNHQAPPPAIPRAEDEQLQYKIQLLLHINSILLARVIQMANNNSGNSVPEQLQPVASQYLKRVHANLQCVSQINQGARNAKPLISDPPQLLVQQPAQDILAKLYLLMTRVFEIW